MLSSRSMTSIARSRNVGAHRSSDVDHLRYFVVQRAKIRLKLPGFPMFTAFREYCTRGSLAAARRQISAVPSVDALSLMQRVKSEYVWPSSESSDCWRYFSEL